MGAQGRGLYIWQVELPRGQGCSQLQTVGARAGRERAPPPRGNHAPYLRYHLAGAKVPCGRQVLVFPQKQPGVVGLPGGPRPHPSPQGIYGKCRLTEQMAG